MLALLVTILTVVSTQSDWLNPAEQAAERSQPGLYRVSAISDGDTISIDMGGRNETVRLIGIDTPETHDPRKPVQCFGQAATAHIKGLIGNNRVRLEADPQNTNRDRYNRLLRYVYLPDGKLINAQIIQDGYGFAYTYFPFSKLEEFRTYEAQARQAGKGLWSSCQIDIGSSGIQQTVPAQ